MDRTLFIDEAAALLGVSRRTVYYRIREGRLLTIRTRCGSQRVLLSSIEALLREEEDRRSVRLQRTKRPSSPDRRSSIGGWSVASGFSPISVYSS